MATKIVQLIAALPGWRVIVGVSNTEPPMPGVRSRYAVPVAAWALVDEDQGQMVRPLVAADEAGLTFAHVMYGNDLALADPSEDIEYHWGIKPDEGDQA